MNDHLSNRQVLYGPAVPLFNYNHNHDPKNGQFTSGDGSGGDNGRFTATGGYSGTLAGTNGKTADLNVAGDPLPSGQTLAKRETTSAEPIEPDTADWNKVYQFILEHEVSSEADYNQTYARPEFPGDPNDSKEQSGVTIGIGYDLGQVSKGKFKEDWRNLIKPADLDRLSKVVGLRGKRAADALQDLEGIKVPLSSDWVP